MNMAYIRKTYDVPARRGGRVAYIDSNPNGDGDIKIKGTITGSHCSYLRIRLDGESRSRLYHPNWNIEYLSDGAARSAGGDDA